VDSWIKAINSSKLQITESDDPLPASVVQSQLKNIAELGDGDEQTQVVSLEFMSDDTTIKETSVICL
jgi:hypothetical protein